MRLSGRPGSRALTGDPPRVRPAKEPKAGGVPLLEVCKEAYEYRKVLFLIVLCCFRVMCVCVWVCVCVCVCV